jgi:DNA-binding NarL/FixJ family response regulator
MLHEHKAWEPAAARRDPRDDIVILTNYSEPGLVERGGELGAHDYLIKAHTPPALLAEATRKWVP